MHTRRCRSAIAAAALAVVLTACGGGDTGPGGERDGAAPTRTGGGEAGAGPSVPVDDSTEHAGQVYVAMGDSYTAAPGVEPAQSDAGACGRSQVNYPTLVQGAFGGSSLVDVSCSGATTDDLLTGQRIGDDTVAPQIDAVTAETTVVTISTGGNDFGAFAALAGECADPAACPGLSLESAQQGLAAITADLVAVVEQVRTRAPEAQVLIVGYPQVVPEGGEGCDALPFGGTELQLARLLNEELAAAQERAAEQAGVGFVDLFDATAGHALCDDEPWINDGDFEGAAPYHPLAAAQRAAALAVIDALGG